MRECIQAEHTYVWVCTARNMQSADHDFLAKHGLTPNLVLSRQLEDDTADHILKKKMIGKLLNLKPFKDCETIFFDDKPKNLQALENLIDFNLNARAINDIGADSCRMESILMNYLYVMDTNVKPRFKIGVSNNPKA